MVTMSKNSATIFLLVTLPDADQLSKFLCRKGLFTLDAAYCPAVLCAVLHSVNICSGIRHVMNLRYIVAYYDKTTQSAASHPV